MSKVLVHIPTDGVYQLPGNFTAENGKMFHGFEFIQTCVVLFSVYRPYAMPEL